MYKKIKYLILFLFVMILAFAVRCNSVLAITPVSNGLYNGIDVSGWQGYVDYSKVKNDGIDIVYIKSSEGCRTKDPYFELNYENAKANGLKVGFYHFLTATSEEEAKEEAEFFSSVIAGKSPDCKLAMDFEEFNGLERYEINNISKIFLETVKNITGKEVIVYSDLYNSQYTFDSEIANNYELWIAYYGSLTRLDEDTSNWSYWIGAQYEDNGNINGIKGYVDRDKYTQEIFLNNNDKPIPESNKTYNVDTKTIIYTVQSGNTLWQISRQYDTTVQEIVDINNIRNANLIYPGEKIKIIENSTVLGSVLQNLGNKIYVVKPGDCLWLIANKFGVTVNQIVKLNNILNPNIIFPGEKLRIK